MTKAAPPRMVKIEAIPCTAMPAAAHRVEFAGRRLARRAIAAGDEHGDRGDELPAGIEADQPADRARRGRRAAECVEAEGQQHPGARHADRRDDRVIMRGRPGVAAVDQEAHRAAEREQRQRRGEREERRVAPRQARARRASGRAASRRTAATGSRRRIAGSGTPRAACSEKAGKDRVEERPDQRDQPR